MKLFNFIFFTHKGFYNTDSTYVFLYDIVQLIIGFKYAYKNRMSVSDDGKENKGKDWNNHEVNK